MAVEWERMEGPFEFEDGGSGTLRPLGQLSRLPERLREFEIRLINEPCRQGHRGTDGRLVSACMVMSNTSLKCPACRLRLLFFHTIYNAEAYWDTEPRPSIWRRLRKGR